jgi:hypothetical protein
MEQALMALQKAADNKGIDKGADFSCLPKQSTFAPVQDIQYRPAKNPERQTSQEN